MVPLRHRAWLLSQSLLWLPLLALAGAYGAVASPAWQIATLALAAASYALLVVNVGAFRTIADRVTIARFTLLLVGASVASARGSLDHTVWIVFGVALAGDFVDGFCARRYGASEAGAILDMETDQFAFLLVGLTAVSIAALPWVLLVLPALRLVKLAAYALARVDAHQPRPRSGDNSAARILCALATALLWLALLPGAPGYWPWACGGTATALLMFSFRVDFRDLFTTLRARRSSRPPRPAAPS